MVAGALPSYNVTWFQAQEACGASRKRLPTGSEWIRAARGTIDPGAPNNGLAAGNAQCNTLSSPAHNPRTTNGAIGASPSQSCVSDWGAQDMIGNQEEWTDEWYAGVGDDTLAPASPWPAAYNGDTTFNITSVAVFDNNSDKGAGSPAAATRGGNYNDGVSAGIFNLKLGIAPASWQPEVGFRCVVSR